jgi:hypothetical protein
MRLSVRVGAAEFTGQSSSVAVIPAVDLKSANVELMPDQPISLTGSDAPVLLANQHQTIGQDKIRTILNTTTRAVLDVLFIGGLGRKRARRQRKH